MGEQVQAKRPAVNLAGALAGGLAALTSAVLLSFTGTTGTVIGAALGSVVVTLGNEVYEYYLRRMAQLREIAHQRMVARAVRGERLIDQQPARPGIGEVLARIPYRKVLLTTAAMFVVVMGVIVSLEMMAGRSVAAMTGASNARTTVPLPGVESTVAPQAPEPSEESTLAPDPQESPSESVRPSRSPTEPLEDEVTPEPTLLPESTTVPDMTETPTEPTPEPTVEPTEPTPAETEVPEEEPAEQTTQQPPVAPSGDATSQ